MIPKTTPIATYEIRTKGNRSRGFAERRHVVTNVARSFPSAWATDISFNSECGPGNQGNSVVTIATIAQTIYHVARHKLRDTRLCLIFGVRLFIRLLTSVTSSSVGNVP